MEVEVFWDTNQKDLDLSVIIVMGDNLVPNTKGKTN